MRIRLSKRQLIGVVMIVVSISAYFALDHVSVSTTPSLDYRVFWRSAAAKHKLGLENGSYVVFEARSPEDDSVIREGKMVGCSPGDRLVVDDLRDSYCNGIYLGHAKATSAKGTPVTAFRYDGVVPENQFYMIGTHRDSYDSRYYGFVSRDRVQEVAWPLF